MDVTIKNIKDFIVLTIFVIVMLIIFSFIMTGYNISLDYFRSFIVGIRVHAGGSTTITSTELAAGEMLYNVISPPFLLVTIDPDCSKGTVTGNRYCYCRYRIKVAKDAPKGSVTVKVQFYIVPIGSEKYIISKHDLWIYPINRKFLASYNLKFIDLEKLKKKERTLRIKIK